jgi:hypothetical protein
VSRIIGRPIVGCSETDGAGRARWVRATAHVLVGVLIANYGASVALNPRKPENPAPSRAAVGTLLVAVSSGASSSAYVWDTVTGKEIVGFPVVSRRPTAKST